MITPPAEPTPEATSTALGLSASQLTRRGFLRAAGVTGLAGVAATVAACQAAGAPSWSFGPAPSGGAPSAAASAAASASVAPSAAASPSGAASPSVAPSASASANPDIPAGWTEHDVAARNVVRRYVGNLAPALETIYGAEVAAAYADILGVEDNYPELTAKPAFVQVPQVVLNDILDPVKPEIDGEW